MSWIGIYSEKILALKGAMGGGIYRKLSFAKKDCIGTYLTNARCMDLDNTADLNPQIRPVYVSFSSGVAWFFCTFAKRY